MCLTETAITIKTTPFRALLILAILSVLFTPAMLSAQILESEFIDRLVDLAPVVNTRDPKVRSLHLRGKSSFANPMFGLHFECTYLGPRRGACTLAHLTGGVPLVVLVDDRIMVFNPEVGIRQWLLPSGSGWRVEAYGTGLDFGTKREAAVVSEIQVDMRRVVTWASEARSVTSLPGNEFLLVGRTPGKGLLEAQISPARAARYTRMKFTGEEGYQPFEIDTLVVNESLQGRALRFPVALEKQLGLQPPVTLTVGGVGEFLQTWLSGLALNKGMYDPSSRKDIEKDLGRSVDWVEVERRNATIGASLRTAMEERD